MKKALFYLFTNNKKLTAAAVNVIISVDK